MTKRKRLIADVVASLFGFGLATAALIVSLHYLAIPNSAMDWAVQICSAVTVGIVIFFLVWGHFQEIPPTPAPLPSENKNT